MVARLVDIDDPERGLSRRAFLARSGLAAGGVASAGLALGGLAACSGGGDDTDGSAAPEFDPADWASVRDQFPLRRDLRHFAAFVLASTPLPVADAIAGHRRGLDEDTAGYLARESSFEEAVATAAADYLGAAADEIAFTDSTTMGLGLLYGGLGLRHGDEILTTEHDFYSTHEALRLRTVRDGAVVRRVRLYDDPAEASVDEIVSRLLAAVTPATRAVAITWVHSSTGVKLPVAEMGAALRDLNAGRADDERVLLCVDGVHGFGVEDTTVGDLGCDFLVSGTHKWLFGPRGTGVVWGRRDAWARVDATIPSFDGRSLGVWFGVNEPDDVPPGPAATPGGYHSFEQRWALADAFTFHLAIGKAAIQRRTHEQATQLKAGLAEIPGVRVVTPMSEDLSAGIVCLAVGDKDPFAAVESLKSSGIVASITPYREAFVRLGPSIVTTPDDVDAVIDAIAALA